MKKSRLTFMAAGVLVLALMTGCGSNRKDIGEESDNVISADMEGGSRNGGEQESRNAAKSELPEEDKNSRTQPQGAASAEDIEKELAEFRAERDEGESSHGTYTLVEWPNEENYHYGVGNIDYASRFDSREVHEVFEAANAYLEDVLNLEGEAWHCVDPRMTAIYEAEDKGVANGYDADNIFLCEYNDNGTWQYLILVREKKDSEWKVLHHVNSYKTD